MAIHFTFSILVGEKKMEKKARKIRKWSKEEIAQIINYICENRNFEQPTAQIYYKKFLQASGMNVAWDLIKWKVRYLKTSFQKAESWRKATGAGILEEDIQNGVTTVNEKLKKMYPSYYSLKEVFGEKQSADVELLDSDVGNENDNSNSILNSQDPDAALQEPAEQPSTSSTVSTFANRLKRAAPKDSLSSLIKSQEGRNEYQRLRIKLDETKFEKEYNLSKEKFEMEKEFRKQEIELKKKEMEKDEKLRMLEIEKSERIAKWEIEKAERIAKYELQLKYNEK